MSSLRRAVKTRTYRERDQPLARRHLGLLEKHKDYVLRARDFHTKEKKLKRMRNQADMRNEDEFYYGMVGTQTQGGIHRVDKKKKYSAKALKQYNAQDLAYVHAFRQHESKKADKLAANMHLLEEDEAADTPKHVIFVDDFDDVEKFDPVQYFDTAPELVSRRHNRPRKETLETTSTIAPVAKKQRRDLARAHRKRYSELATSTATETKLTNMAASLQLRRHLMGKGRRMKVKNAEGDQPAVYRWRRERKK